MCHAKVEVDVDLIEFRKWRDWSNKCRGVKRGKHDQWTADNLFVGQIVQAAYVSVSFLSRFRSVLPYPSVDPNTLTTTSKSLSIKISFKKKMASLFSRQLHAHLLQFHNLGTPKFRSLGSTAFKIRPVRFLYVRLQLFTALWGKQEF